MGRTDSHPLPIPLLMVLGLVLSLGHTGAQENPEIEPTEAAIREVPITVVAGRLMFSPRMLMAQPGERILFKVKNTGELTHNFVIGSQGDGDWKGIAATTLDLGEAAMAQGYNPGPPLVFHATPLLRHGEEAVLEWRAPDKAGIFPFLSTVPGHASLMRGEVAVLSEANLSNLRYAYYEGKWAALPEFSELEPMDRGKLNGNRVDFGEIGVLAEREEARRQQGVKAGLVITGDVNLPQMGTYAFALSSRGARARLTVSEATVIEHDGETAGTRFSGASHTLDDGHYGMVLEVAGAGSPSTPGIAWRGPSGAEVLSVEPVDAFSWPGQFVIEGDGEAPLAVTVPMPNASALALAVALPDGVNYCFDPETQCVRYAWAGEFLDAAPAPDDGSGRLGGNCRPLGKVISLGGDFRFPLRIGDLASDGSGVRYLGHTSGGPDDELELLFKTGEYTVAQKISVTRDGPDRLEAVYRFRLDPAPAPDVPVMFYADPREVEVTTPDGFARKGVALLTVPEGEETIEVKLRPISAD